VGNVLFVDVFSENQKQIKTPSQYGLSNVKDVACNLSYGINPLATPTKPGSSLACKTSNLIAGDTSRYLFADSVHPTLTGINCWHNSSPKNWFWPVGCNPLTAWRINMKTCLKFIAAATLISTSWGVSAQSAGTRLVRFGVTHIAPQVTSDNMTAPSFANTQTDVGSDTQLGGGLTYMYTDNVSFDLPVALPFTHKLYGAGRWPVQVNWAASRRCLSRCLASTDSTKRSASFAPMSALD